MGSFRQTEALTGFFDDTGLSLGSLQEDDTNSSSFAQTAKTLRSVTSIASRLVTTTKPKRIVTPHTPQVGFSFFLSL